MPSPKPDDPLLCRGSGSTDYDIRLGAGEQWLVCPMCKRALKPTKPGPTESRPLRPHRIRSRNTRSLDQTRDILAGITDTGGSWS